MALFILKIDAERLHLNPARFQTKDLRPNHPFFGIRFQPILDEFDDDTNDLETRRVLLLPLKE